MRIISETRIKDFWRDRHGDAVEAERAFRNWIRIVRYALWKDFADLKGRTFGSADRVGDCIVFDVGNNRYRLIGRVRFRAKIVYILKVMDHAEYDLNRWQAECGCKSSPLPPGSPRKGRRS